MLKLIYFAVFGMLLFAYQANAVELKPMVPLTTNGLMMKTLLV